MTKNAIGLDIVSKQSSGLTPKNPLFDDAGASRKDEASPHTPESKGTLKHSKTGLFAHLLSNSSQKRVEQSKQPFLVHKPHSILQSNISHTKSKSSYYSNSANKDKTMLGSGKLIKYIGEFPNTFGINVRP
jgi:hypothetical protein